MEKIGLEWVGNILKETGQEAIVEPIAGFAKKQIYEPDMSWYGEGGVVDPGQMIESGEGGGRYVLGTYRVWDAGGYNGPC